MASRLAADPPPGAWIEKNGTRALTSTTQRWVTTPKTVRKCGTPIHLTVAIHYSPRRPLIKGLQQCRNRFVCPHCSWHLRAVLAQRWNHSLTDLFAVDYTPAFMTLSLPPEPHQPLSAALSDLTAAWQRFRSLDAIELYKSSTLYYAWALEVTTSAHQDPKPQLNCFTLPYPSGDPDQTPTHVADHVAGLWSKAAHATTGRSVPTRHTTHTYLTPTSTQPIVNYAVGLGPNPTQQAAGTKHRYTLLDLALRAHLRNDRKAAHLLAKTAQHLNRRKSHIEAAYWKRFAKDINTVSLDAKTIYETIYTPDPKPLCIIRSTDYTQHKTAIDHWSDTTTNLPRPDLYKSLLTLLFDQCDLLPARLTPPEQT